MTSKTVLVTGCSTGIGRDLVQRLSTAGYAVVATARRVETLDDLPAKLKLPLDVTRTESVDAAVESVIKQLGRIDVLVNNAGYAVRGAVEEVPVDSVQEMFEVNVYGVMRLVHAVVPHMRQQKAGCIVNIGSIAGKLVVPVNGTYSASKFALEALSDAMRLELAQFGVQVALVEPGNIRTQFKATAEGHAHAILTNAHSPYYSLYQHYLQTMQAMREGEPGPEAVSRVVQQAIESEHPKARYAAGVPFTNRLVLLIGDRARDFAIKRMFKIPPDI